MFGLEALRRAFAGEARRGGNWRAVVDELLASGKLPPGDYLKALGEGSGPAHWTFALFVFFGAAQLVAGIVMFFAYNWRDLSDIAKIALPQVAMALAFFVFALTPARSAASRVAAVVATAMIGVSMGVVGQVYQLGADPWTLFAIWAAFALPIALIARSDALFAVWFLIASTAYFLYADEHLRPRLEMDQSVSAIYAGAAILILIARELAGGAPRWLRWLFIAAALGTAVSAGLDEVMASDPFKDGYVGTAALFAGAAAVLFYYGAVRPDRPARALALFALAVYVGAAGVRTVWRLQPDGAGEAAIAFIGSAVWVVAVTGALAFLLRGRQETSR